MRILIVDDEAILRRGLNKILLRLNSNFQVVGEAENGLEAIGKIKKLNPDVIITDIKMPEMDGIDLAKEVDEMNKSRNISTNISRKIRMIMLSGYAEFEFARNAMKYGASEYILKPINENQLNEILNKIAKEIEDEDEKNNFLEIYHNSGLPALKEKIMRNLIYYSELEQNDLKLIIRKIGLFSLHPYFIVVCLKTERILDAKEKLPDCKDICNLTCNSDGITLFYLFTTSDEAVLLLNFDSTKLDTGSNKLVISGIMEDLATTSGYSVNLGVSDIFFDIVNTHEQYEKALKALQMKFYEGRNKIIYYTECAASIKEIPTTEFDSLLGMIRNIVESDNILKLQEFIDKLFNIFYKCRPDDKDEVYVILYFLYHRFTETVMFFSKYASFQKEDFIKQLKSFQYIGDMKNYFKNVLINLVKLVHAKKNNAKKILVNSAVEFINQHFAENIKLERVASHIYISTCYLSELFKQEMNINFIDYLIQIRIEYARNLLRDKSLKITDISSKVGYEDSNYFSRAFRKKVGVSPKEFRDSIH